MIDTHDLRLESYLDLLKLLVREPSVVGAEEPFFRVLHRELEARGARVTRSLGLLVAEGGEPRHGMISAHVDRHGLLCTGPGEFQYAAFIARNRADLTGDSVSEQTFLRLRDRFRDETVTAYDPWTGGSLGQAQIMDTILCPRRQNLVFRLDGLDGLTPGSPAGYLDRLEAANGTLRGQLDNVLTVAALVHAFDLGFRGTAFFTAQEEAGRSWRFLLEWFQRCGLDTDGLLVIDTSPFPDPSEAARHDLVLRRRDANAAFATRTVDRVLDACAAPGVRTMFKDALIERQNGERAQTGQPALSFGRTELGRLASASGGRVSGATIQVPTAGYHTRHESASLASVEALLRVLGALWVAGPG